MCEKKLHHYYFHKISNFNDWNARLHAKEYLIFPENIGTHLCIDETALSNGELYTIVSNDTAKCKKGAIVAIVKGVKSDVVSAALNKIRAKLRYGVQYIAMDFSKSMSRIARISFKNAIHVIDRFHVQKLINDTVQDVRIKNRWKAQEIDDNDREKCKTKGTKFERTIFFNEETIAQLFTRSRYALTQMNSLWSESQKERIEILFNHFPDVQIAYNIAQDFRNIIFNKDEIKKIKKRYINYAQREEILNLIRETNNRILSENEYIVGHYRTMLNIWYNNVEKSDEDGAFRSIIKTFQDKATEIINYYINGFSNARAEALNSKIKDFRRNLKGVRNQTYFLFRLKNILAE